MLKLRKRLSKMTTKSRPNNVDISLFSTEINTFIKLKIKNHSLHNKSNAK